MTSSSHWCCFLALCVGLGWWPASAAASQTQERPVQVEVPDPDPIPELPSRSAKKVSTALRGLKKANEKKRENIRKSLVEAGRGALPRIIEEVVKPELAPESQEVLRAAMAAITNQRDRRHFEEWCKHDAEPMRFFAVGQLAAFEDPRCAGTLKGRLRDKSERVVVAAAEILVQRGEPAAFKELVPVLAKAEGRKRTRILEYFQGYRKTNASVADAARNLMDSEDLEIRVATLEALHQSGDPKAIRVYEKALDDQANRIKGAAVNGLRELLEKKQPFEGATAFALIEEVQRLKKLLEEKR